MKMRLMGVKIPEDLYTRMLHYKAEVRGTNGLIVTDALKYFLAIKESELPQLKVDLDQKKLSDVPTKEKVLEEVDKTLEEAKQNPEEVVEDLQAEAEEVKDSIIVEAEPTLEEASVKEDFDESVTEKEPRDEVIKDLGDEKVE